MMKVAVIIPCYKVRAHVMDVLARMPAEITRIYCVDDACPEGSGKLIEDNCKDRRVRVLFHEKNRGVGGAVITGYKAALEEGADVILKIDGDGQMDPALIPVFVRPIEENLCDYAKGNRFYHPEGVKSMPPARLFGNAVLSFLTKLSSGYWHIFDPTNGYTAIHAAVLREIPLDKISRGYFFESDMLFRLNIIRAVVRDIPMRARYGGESSNLSIVKVVPRFLWGHGANFLKRVVYNYFLRDFSVASLELLAGPLLFVFGLFFGLEKWAQSVLMGVTASAGTVMLSALPVLVGIQMMLSFLQYDIQATPREPIHGDLMRLN